MWRYQRTWTALLLLVSTLLLLGPVLLTPELPLLDLPNHLGRIHILLHLRDTPGLRALYDVRLAPTPNLAMDLLLMPLAAVLGPEAAARVFLALTMLLVALGWAALCRLGRGRLDEAALLGLPLAHTVFINHGALNYVWGIGCALLTYALWWRLGYPRPRLRGLLALPPAALFTYFMHLMGFGVLGILLGSSVLYGALAGRLRAGDLARQLILGALVAAVPVALYLRFSSGVVGGSGVHQAILWLPPAEKLRGLLRVLRATVAPLDAPLLVLVLALVFLGFRLGLRRRFLRAASAERRTLAVAGLLLLFLGLLSPHGFDLESAEVDWRLAYPGYLLFLAAAIELPERPRARQAVLLLLVVATAARSSGVLRDWRQASRWLTQARALCPALPAGARVMTLHNEEPRPGDSPFYASENYAWSYCLFSRPLFFPALFHAEGSQPLVLRLPVYEGTDTVAHYHIKNGFLSPQEVREIPWAELWRLSDYLWLTNWDLREVNAAGLVDPACFEEVGRQPEMALYRLRKERPGCPVAGPAKGE